MLKKIRDRLLNVQSFHMDDDFEEKFLQVAEEVGMLPPPYLQGGYYGHHRYEWELEDEK